MRRYLNSRNSFTPALSPAPYIRVFGNLMLVLALWLCTGTLLFAQTSVTADPSKQSSVPKSFTLKNSQTLDKVIQEVYKDSPLSHLILRNALLSANPLILSGNPAQKIKAGLTLSVPDHTQLVMKTLKPLTIDEEVADKQHKTNSEDASARRNWVRFP